MNRVLEEFVEQNPRGRCTWLARSLVRGPETRGAKTTHLAGLADGLGVGKFLDLARRERLRLESEADDIGDGGHLVLEA